MSAFKDGMRAFRRPQKQGEHYFITANPHPEGLPQNKEWELGFSKAFYGNLERVQKYEQHRAGS